MTNRKNTTRARFVASALAMLLCVAMLVGTTFAWFSDEAKTGPTNITAGNLDVEITSPNGETVYSGADPKSIFGDEIKTFPWEPGAMYESGDFVIKNNGTLALQYKANIALTNTSSEGDPDLTEVIQAKVVDPSKLEGVEKPGDTATQKDRQDYWEALSSAQVDVTNGIILPETYTAEEELPAGTFKGQTDTLKVVLYWLPYDSTSTDPEVNPDNKYNKKDNDNPLTADFALDVFATQYTSESDSFGPQYDAGLTLDAPKAGEAKAENPYDLKGGTIVYTGTETSNNSIYLTGSGTADLAEGSVVENTDEVSGYTFRVSGKEGTPANVTFTGKGTVIAPPNEETDDGAIFLGHAVRIDAYANVTIESGNYEGIYFFGLENGRVPGPTVSTLVINGGKITGFVNVLDAAQGTDLITINDGEAVKDALFLSGDKDKITIPDDYEWKTVQDDGSDKYPEIAGSKEQTYMQLVQTPAA